MKKYAGITIGPIFDTISDATSPAALWFASTFFSDITRRICKEIIAAFPKEGNQAEDSQNSPLISPYFDREDEAGLKNGVGKYHDRIFFSVEAEEEVIHSRLKEIIKKVKAEVTENFGDAFFERQPGQGEAQDPAKRKETRIARAAAFLESYLQIHYIVVEKEKLNGNNCILGLSPYLDALELMKAFPVSNEGNPFRELTFGRDDGAALVQMTRLYTNVDPARRQIGGGRSRNLKQIAEGGQGDASPDKDRKYPKYYAVVSADADGMGKFLSSISAADKADHNITKFSERCLSYDKVAADAIHRYGGMTIYAGGDDLLFLAPVMKGKKNIFCLCGELSRIFQEQIKGGGRDFEEKTIPTVSFGVSVQYYKYPLYEALKRSRECLEKAKKETFKAPDAGAVAEKKKDCIYFHLEKHSGQSADLLIGNEALDLYVSLLKTMLEYEADGQGVDEKMVKSMGSKLYEFREIIRVMDVKWDRQGNHPSWKNLFDNEGQTPLEKFRTYVESWYYEHMVKENSRIVTVSGYDSRDQEEQRSHSEAKPAVQLDEDYGSRNLEERRFHSLLAALRIGKFFLEKNDEKEKGGE